MGETATTAELSPPKSLSSSHFHIALPRRAHSLARAHPGPCSSLATLCSDCTQTLYAAQRDRTATANHTMQSVTIPPEQVDQPEDQFITTFFCRALYDYQTNDASSLSFRKGDIIEVLTRLESGWWDGLLGEERGWFPSNYVAIISDQEAEVALSVADGDSQHPPMQDESLVDMVQGLSSMSSVSNMSRALSQSDRDGDWLDRDSVYSTQPHPVQHNGSEEYYQVEAPQDRAHDGAQHDFWVPRVGVDGRVRLS